MKSDKLLNVIKGEQAKNGWVSEEAMAHISQDLKLPMAHVYGVTTFYSFLSTEPVGRHVIRACKSVPCFLQNGETIIASIEKELGIAPGETSPDGRFTFLLTNCIGACDQAPAMLVNDALYGNLTPGKIRKILQSFD